MDKDLFNKGIQQRSGQLRGGGILLNEVDPFPGVALGLLYCIKFHSQSVTGEDGEQEQEIEIFYRFIGKID